MVGWTLHAERTLAEDVDPRTPNGCRDGLLHDVFDRIDGHEEKNFPKGAPDASTKRNEEHSRSENDLNRFAFDLTSGATDQDVSRSEP